MKRLTSPIFTAVSALIVAMGVSALPASAQQVLNTGTTAFGAQTALGTGGEAGLIGIISNIINIGLGFLGIIVVLYMLYGGFMWMTSGGEAEKVEKAKRTIVQAVIGLTITLSSWGIAVFVLNAVGGATGANVEGNGLGGSGNGGGGNFQGPGPDAFVVQGIAPAGSGQNRNIVVRAVFNKPVNPATVEGNVQIAFAGQPVPGTVNVVGQTVEFIPTSPCPNPNSSLNCLDEDKEYTVTISANVKSTDDKALSCGGFAPACSANFTTGANVDTTAPTGMLTGPADGTNFNINDGITFQSQVNDNVALSKVDYFADGAVVTSDAAQAPLVSWTSSRNWKPGSVVLGKTYRLTAKVFDTASNSADAAGAVMVVARGPLCFNGVKDGDETGPDCGGASCGTCLGGSCTANTDCASGTCANGVCVAQPIIQDIQAKDGAAGNFITITGQNFGSGGTIKFLGGAGAADDVTSVLACSGAWTDSQIVVVVPDNAATGPLSVTTNANLSDTTADARGPQLSFTVNDIKRPSLCSLSPMSGKVGTQVLVKGKGFGTQAMVAMGNMEGQVDVQNDSEFTFIVPSFPDATYPVAVVVGDEMSNSLNFRVVTPAPVDPPTIVNVTPASGPMGQYITLQGSNFGTAGTVRFVRGSEFALGDVTFPAVCGTEFWRPSTVMVKVPSKMSDGSDVVAGDFALSLSRSSGDAALSTNSVAFTVTTGAPTPGICRIDPSSGPVNTPFKVYGDGFGTVMGSVAMTGGNASVADWGMSEVRASVPATAKTGEVRLTTAAAAQSNPTFFQVGSCTENPSICGQGQQCCENGSCSATCSVTPASQTYAWRFSTGKIPVAPKLVTQCDMAQGTVIPSPSPSAARPGGNQVCSNAVVTAVFENALDPTTINGTSVKVWECADDTCAATVQKPGVVAPFNALNTAFMVMPQTAWKNQTTYLVEVTTNLKTATSATVLGANAVADAACNRGAATNNAFCWKFTTGNAPCDAEKVAVVPSIELATEPYDAMRPAETAKAFTAQPLADPRTCLALNPSGFTYSWSSTNNVIAAILTGGTSANATVSPLKETNQNPVFISAKAVGQNNQSADGKAELNIRFARPRVTAFEPNCQDACVNSSLRATFNTAMNPSSVDIQLMLCSDAECKPEARVGNIVTGLSVTATADKMTYSVSPQNLVRGSYYRALIPAESGANCKGCSAAGISLVEEGSNFAIGNNKYFSWIFRTRNDATLCSVSQVDLEPISGSVPATGAGLIKYAAVPRSSPDACSAAGQALDPWGYDWTWAIGTPGIAGELLNASGVGTVKSGTVDGQGKYIRGVAAGYTAQCVKRGADTALGLTAKCGNGAWENTLGEACDDGNTLDGDGCSKTCLIEAFSGTGVWTRGGINGSCGDERVQRSSRSGVGEECDDGASGSAQCSAQCKVTGVSAGVCGNGSVNPGESCDDGNTVSGDGCSASCLSEGSISTISVCGDSRLDAGEECDNISVGSATAAQVWASCNQQTCLWKGKSACTAAGQSGCCGNGVKETGEQCDDNNSASGDGCSALCLAEGSNAAYAVPSFCGDGIVGTGEVAGSEASMTRTVTDPIQYVRRVATPSAPYATTVKATTRGVTGTANFSIAVQGLEGNQCVVQTTPACDAADAAAGMAACQAAGGACQSGTGGSRCVIENAPSCTACAAAGGVCVESKPELVIQCGTNSNPANIPSPAPLVTQTNVATSMQSDVCTNALVSGVFNVAMNADTVKNSLVIFDCGTGAIGGDCASGNKIDSAQGFWMDADNKSFHVKSDWTAGKVYMVALTTSMQSASGAAADADKLVLGTGCGKVGQPVHACWQFKVGTSECAPSALSVTLAPNPATQLGQSVQASANVLNERCVEMNAANYTFNWTSTSQAVANFTTPSPQTINTSLQTVANGTTSVEAAIVQAPLVRGSELLTVGVQTGTCASGQGQNSQGLCANRPKVQKTTPPNGMGADATPSNTAGAPRNAAVSVEFSEPMQEASLTALGAWKVEYEGACGAQAPANASQNPSSISVWCQTAIAGTTELIKDGQGKVTGVKLMPTDFLPALKWHRITVSKAVKSESGVTLADANEADFTAYFRTGARIAPLTGARITDSQTVNPGLFNDPSKSSRTMSAVALGRTSDAEDDFEIFPVKNAYAWEWNWGPGSEESAAFGVSATAVRKSPPTQSPTEATVTAVKPTELSYDGVVFATAQIKTLASSLQPSDFYDSAYRVITLNGTATGIQFINVFPCANPWPNATDASNFPFVDQESGYSMFYCRTAQPSLLPELRVQKVASAAADVLREYLFIAGQGSIQTSDAIGLRVIKNPTHLPIMEWYRSKGFTGNPQLIKVDGYQALQDGRTLYIGGANLANDSLYTNIYVLSYNAEAKPDTINIYNQLVKNFRLNPQYLNSLENINLCVENDLANAPIIYKDGKVISCTADATCIPERANGYPEAVCASAKSKLSRDVQRLMDFRVMSSAIGGVFQQTSQVPALSAGSFLRAFTTSVWPSWDAELTQAVGLPNLPKDPSNSVICASQTGVEQTTCWNQTEQVFECAEGSTLYAYTGIGTDTANMGINFETPKIYSKLTEKDANNGKGMGICEKSSPNAGEPCSLVDAGFACGALPGNPSQAYKCVDAVEDSGAVLQLDNAGICGRKIGATARCGDGIVSVGEVCEVGQAGVVQACQINGKQGSQLTTCNASCTGFVASGACAENSCGNGKVDLGVCSNNPSKTCSTKVDCGGSLASIWGPWCFGSGEVCDDGANNGKYGYCNATCTGKGASCGDGIVGAGETCDCGAQNGIYGQTCANAGANGCSASCQLGAPRCGDGIKQPQEQCEVGEVKVEQNTCPGLGPSGRTLIKKMSCSQSSCQWDAGQCVEKGSCGDGVKDSGEQCDDGNTADNDACSAQCTLNVCGDSKLNVGIEECDDGSLNGQSCNAPYGGVCNFCSSQCRLRTISGAICGNNKAESGEQCDGADFGGKMCVGGDTAGSICNTDAECGTGGKCAAQFCMNGLHCSAYDNKTTADVLTDGTKIREWIAGPINFGDRYTRNYCTNNVSQSCNLDADCGQGNACIKIATNTLGTVTTQPSDNFAVVCEGYVTPKYSETYTFKFLSDDQGRLRVDNRTLIDSWVAQDSSALQTGSIALTAGKRYSIKIEHSEVGGSELFSLLWQSSTQKIGLVPSSALSYAPAVSGNSLSCTVAGQANNQLINGICIGGMNGVTSTDGTSCSVNSQCGTGGVCSFVPGTCFNPSTLSSATDGANTVSSCRSSSDCADNANNTSCGAGICNGGTANGKVCAANNQCGTNSSCSFARCNTACSAFCPTQTQPINLAFRTIDSTSKCTYGHISNVGGLCSQDANCNKNTCSANSPTDCVGGTQCVAGKCEFVTTGCGFGEYIPKGSNTCTACPGYVNADGTCAMCAPGTAPKTTVALGNTADIAGVQCVLQQCTGGIYTASNLTRSCTQVTDCLDLPNKAWLEIPVCRALPKARMDINAASWTKQPLNVVFITDNTASMMAPYNGGEGSYAVPFNCDTNANDTDSRIECAINNLVGLNNTTPGTALDQIFTYDQNLTKVALLNYGAVGNAGYLEPKENWTVAEMPTKNPAQAKTFVKVGSWDAQVLALKLPQAPQNMNQLFFGYSDISSVKSFIRTEYNKLEPAQVHPGSCPEQGVFDLAGKMLEGKPGKRVVIVLSDACDGDSGRSSILTKANTELKQKGVEVYAISYGLPKQGWQLAEWSSDCSASAAFSELKNSFQPNGVTSYETANCSSSGHFYQTSATNDLKTIYGKIVDQIKLATVKLWYPTASSASILAPGTGRELDPSYLRCQPGAVQRIPLTLEFSGYGQVQLGNASAEYCPATP